jgi:hypothetical protein
MKVVVALVAVVALAGCNSPGVDRAVPSAPAAQPPLAQAGPTLSPSSEPAPNAEAVAKGKALLTSIGIQDVGEAEHGFREASLSGRWDEYDVIAFVAPPGVPLPTGRVVGVRDIGGKTVTTLRVLRAPLRVRFDHDGFTVDLQVFDGDFDEISLDLTNALVDGLLWPQ